ncbi:MAG TPA: HEAT repeat domain-containing protein, partial [Blastocatellia bacterium]|nr:HEAT repeat domain-containing protein [Blastocatellia bacterium]
IDFYGLNRVSRDEARAALTFAEGDTLTFSDERPAMFRSAEDRLRALHGVVSARVNAVCCDAGRMIVYVGVQERGTSTLQLRQPPRGMVRLPADVVRTGEEFSKSFMAAVERGDAGEDRSQGHSLMHDPATRAIQQQFIVFARRDFSLLREVLRDCSETAQRALAAQVLGYAADKQTVVADLVRAMRDPAEEVRNTAIRALMVFAETKSGPTSAAPRIPAEPFIKLLNSPVWSDRNKASLALQALSAARDPKLLGELRKALQPLVEMARWRSAGHALPAFWILARLAGISDEAAQRFWDLGNRDAVIDAATRPGR